MVTAHRVFAGFRFILSICCAPVGGAAIRFSGHCVRFISAEYFFYNRRIAVFLRISSPVEGVHCRAFPASVSFGDRQYAPQTSTNYLLRLLDDYPLLLIFLQFSLT